MAIYPYYGMAIWEAISAWRLRVHITMELVYVSYGFFIYTLHCISQRLKIAK